MTLADDAFVKKQNENFREESKTTDVLSFPQLPPQKNITDYCGHFLGDILVSLDEAERQAQSQGITLREEVLFLILHSILHLIGHDHAEDAEREHMQKLEAQIFMKIK